MIPECRICRTTIAVQQNPDGTYVCDICGYQVAEEQAPYYSPEQTEEDNSPVRITQLIRQQRPQYQPSLKRQVNNRTDGLRRVLKY